MSCDTLVNCIKEYTRSSSDENFAQLSRFIKTGEFRDNPLQSEDYGAIFGFVLSAFIGKSCGDNAYRRVNECRSLALTVMKSDEFEGPVASGYLPDELVGLIVSRASPARMNEQDVDSETRYIESFLSVLYRKLVEKRGQIRAEIGRFLRDFILIPTRSSHLTPILNFLKSIISGMTIVDRNFFQSVLLPLHKPNGWSFWDRQTPVLGEYHKALVHCCQSIIDKDRSLATDLIEYILNDCFAPVHQSNTAKELLLLFEISKFIALADMSRVVEKLMERVLDCINSENAQVVQSVLIFWKSPEFVVLFNPFLTRYMERLLLALFRGTGEPHWNPTVNKMSLLVLKALEESNFNLFESSAEKVIPEIDLERVQIFSGRPVPRVVVPSPEPQLCVTGVAPWQNEPQLSTVERRTDETQRLKGLCALREFIKRLHPPAHSLVCDKKPWLEALSNDTPTLLPDLKFHNLVFGKDLGQGAFSTVRYARVVKTGKYLSDWDEVAVKMITYETVSKHNYGENILREIFCLRKLSHPSVARLISSFRWRDGIYLVLCMQPLATFTAMCENEEVCPKTRPES